MGILQKKKSRTAAIRQFFFLVFPFCHHLVSRTNGRASMIIAGQPFAPFCQKYSIRTSFAFHLEGFLFAFFRKKGELVC